MRIGILDIDTKKLGYNTEEEEDVARVELLHSLGCDIHPMLFRDLNGRVNVDGYGKPQRPHSSSVRDWVKSYLYKTIPLHEFTKYQKRMEKYEAEKELEAIRQDLF